MIIREAFPIIFFHYTKSQPVAELRFCVTVAVNLDAFS